MSDAQALLYCVTDREIYDFLLSSKQRITSHVMLELAKDRGIFLSPHESRSRLAEILASLPQDYFSLQSYMAYGQASGRGERITSFSMDKSVKSDVILEVINKIRDSSDTAKFTVTRKGDNFSIKVEYSEWDYGKNALNQRRIKESEIEILQEASGYKFRMPLNDKTQEIVTELQTEFEKITGKNIHFERIELKEIKDSSFKTQFFMDLIHAIPNYKHINVTRVRIEADAASIAESNPEEELTADLEAEIERAEGELLSVMTSVDRVSIKGNGLLSSDIFRQLRDKGFFIGSIVWTVREKGSGSYIELEAGFDDPHSGTGFKYAIRGYRPMSPRNPGELTKNMKSMPNEDKNELYPKIENAAKRIQKKILELSFSEVEP